MNIRHSTDKVYFSKSPLKPQASTNLKNASLYDLIKIQMTGCNIESSPDSSTERKYMQSIFKNDFG